MLVITGTALFPALYLLSENRVAGTTFILAALFTLLVVTIAVFGFMVIFKRHGYVTLTKEGVGFQDHNRVNFFRRWEEIQSYRIATETERYYSNEMNSYQENKAHSIILTLANGTSIGIPANKLAKSPAEIIGLFDLYKKLPAANYH